MINVKLYTDQGAIEMPPNIRERGRNKYGRISQSGERPGR